MVSLNPTLTGLVVAILLGQSLAHPGHSLDQEIAERSAYLAHSKRDLSHCAAKMKARGVEARALNRRSNAVSSLREAVKARKARRDDSFVNNHQPPSGNGHQPWSMGEPGNGHGEPGHGMTHAPPSFTTSVSESIYPSDIESLSGTTTSSSVISTSTSSSTSTTTSSSAASAASGSAPSGSMPSGGGNSTGNSTGGAGQLASSISTFGEEVANTTHLSNLTVTPSTSGVEEIIFGNHSCILNPEGEVGPFYVTGELIRSDITETQAGVPVTIDGQFIDVNTCEPIDSLYWDIWHANSTGVYGGVIGNGNGNSDDTSNLNNTFLRGLQPTDSDGVAQFTSVFPGHYAGRATHIHVVSHIGGHTLSNGTYAGGNITHIGQLFFDQDLITEINTKVSPYSTNTIAIVDNVDDRVFAEETLTDSDPVFDYVLLGDDVTDGLFIWITMGVDSSSSYTASAAAAYGADGGVLE